MTNYLLRYLRRKVDPLDLLVRLAKGKSPFKTLVHVGAHLAQERTRYEDAGLEKILWIEGSPTTYSKLSKLIEQQNKDNLDHRRVARHAASCALMTDMDGEELTLKGFSNDGMSSSIFATGEAMKKRWPTIQETGLGETCKTFRLDTLMAGQDFIEKIDVLVVDVQGAELVVLKGASTCLAQARAVICEVSSRPYYEGGVLYPELAALLKSCGFEPQSVPRRHGDMLFIKG